ncbi:MAG: tetratricopeptide repeat protein [Deltaproteobacteria bacterium]|nr:tetratricopeptide repeat protein [Deltaproteobacteria bacterium]
MTRNRLFVRYASLVTFLVSTAFVAGVANAQAKYRKKEIEVAGGQQTQLTKPKEPPKEQAKQTGPVLTVEAFVGGQQKKIVQITKKQILYMRELIRNAPEDDPMKPDYYFRLGELLADTQRYFGFQARSLDQKIWEAEKAKNTSQANSLKQKQQKLEKNAERWSLEAVKNYVAASRYPKYNRMDEVLFRLAFLLQMIKKEDQAREFFHRLIKDYPQSKYVPNAYLSFAEFYFQKGEMENAGKFYEKVTQFTRSSVFGFALYKKGWVEINLGNFKNALGIFVRVIELCRAGKIPKNQAGPLEKEAKKDLVKAYARTPGASPDKAWDFFQRMGGSYAPKMLESLAELYWEQGMFNESSRVYRKIITLNEKSPRLCEWQNKILRNTLSGGDKRDQVQELKRLGNVYEAMVKRTDVKKDVMAECKNAYHDTGKELALIWHKEAQRTKNSDTYQLAGMVYKEFLSHFGKEKDTPEITFYYGEILWQMNAWKEAAETYTKVVQLAPKGKYVKEAAYAAVLAWKNALNIDDSGEGVDKDKMKEKDPLKPRPIPEYQKKMIDAFDTYIKYVPDAPELVKIKYRKARIFYDYNHFEEATKLFGDIVDRHVNDELAIYSANLLLDCFNIMKRYKELLATVEKYLRNPVLMKDEEFRKQMVSLKTDSLVAEAKQYEKDKNYKECGISFIAAAETIPDHKDHAQRLYNAGLCFQNARLIGQAIKAREQLIAAHPKDPLAQRALFQIASGYHQLAYYSEAAKRYEEFAGKFPGEKHALTALGNAYSFRIGLGEFEKAVEDMNSFVKYYGNKKPADAANVVFQMSEVYEKQKKTDELARHLEAYLKRWGARGGIDKQILAHFKLGEIAWTRSCPQEGVNGACIKVQRVTMDGKRKAFYVINSKIKDRRKKLKEKLRTQCGPPTSSKITVFDRSKKLAAQAQKHFSEVLKLWARGDAERKLQKQVPNAGEAAARAVFMRFAVAGAAFYQAEQVYEQFLRVKFPQGLDFQQPTQYDSKKVAEAKKKKYEDSSKKFMIYLTDKTKLAERLAGPSKEKKGMYDFVLEYHVAHWTIAASARIGQVFADFVNQLYTAEIPKDLEVQDKWGNRPREIFCDALVDKAEPIESKAVVGYELCLKAATEQSWFNEWSTMCEVELNQMKPAEYPLAAEAKPEPGYVSTPITPAAVVSELPDDVQVVVKD